MSFCSKEKMERNDCVNNSIKSHLTRSERETIRVCPSKLSKRELEDLYFTLLGNNLELKKTIHKQQDKIKVLSTQVQRMTNNQEKLVNKEMKECCTGTRAFINEQKVLITELKDTNQRMADRIQQLTLRLSSAKQFSKTSPPQPSAARFAPFRVMTSLTPKKHDCLTKAQESPPQTSHDEPRKSTFSQWEDELPNKATQTQMPIEKSPNSCDANKCRTLMEELKLEIFTLQEELTIVHYDYSTRIGRLETEVAEVRKENVRVGSERTASQHELQNTLKQNNDILATFRKSEAKCAELAAELSIEKRKVAELDTFLKAANLTDRLNKTMEEHLITLTETLQSTVVAPKETDENPLKCRCGGPPPPKVTDGMAADKSWLPEITKNKKEPAESAEDRIGKSSPTKLIMLSKSTSSASKAIKVENETTTKTRSKDCKNQEYPYPPPKDLSPRPEDRKNLGNPPIKDLSTRLDDRKNQEHPYPPLKDLSPRPEERQKPEYPPPKDLSPRPEERQKPEYPPPKDLSPRPEERQKPKYPPPKDLSTRPEDRRNLGNPPYAPPKELSTRLDDRKNQEHPYPPPKDWSPRPEDCSKVCCSSSFSTELATRPAGRICCNNAACSHAQKKTSQLKSETIECGCFPPPQAKKEEDICRCPTWVLLPQPPPQDKDTKCKICCYSPRSSIAVVNERTSIDRFPSPPLMDHFVEEGQINNKCCKKDKPGANESPPRRNDNGLSTRGARSGFSPTKYKDDTKSTNTADDSGYQESDEMGLVKMNKELLLKILELQNQVDCMKIGVSQMSEAQSGKLRERQETPAKSTNPTVTTTPIKSPALLADMTKASLSSCTELVRHASVDSTSARIDSPPSLKSESEREIEKTLPFPPKASEECVNQPQQQKLRIEVLGDPKDSESSQIVAQLSDETRAKTVKCRNGTLHIPEDRSTSTSYDSTTEYKTPTLTITEKKKPEVADSNQPDMVTIKAGIGSSFAFNPEKLKYLENEGIIAKLDLENHQAKLEEDLGSITESVPSNPELGFDIPRLASKDKKVEIGSGQAKTSPAADPSPQRVRNDNLEILPGKLKLPMTETLEGNYPTATEQTDETKKEDCEYCAVCSFDKECELKHENALNTAMTKLAHGMQKDQIENHDLLNALQKPDATPTSDNNKKDKKKNMFCHLMKDMNRKQKTRSLTIHEMFANQKVHAQKTSITTGHPVNLADGPLFDQRENSKTNSFLQRQNSITVAKKTILEKDKCLQKEKKEHDVIESPILLTKHTSDTAVGPVILPNVPLLAIKENRKLRNDTTDIETKTRHYNQDIPMFEIKTPTEETRLVERTADVFQSPEHKLPEKASQAITTTTYKAEAPRVGIRESARQRDVSMRASRSVSVSPDQPACDCPGEEDGYCTNHSKNKGVHGNEAKKLGFPRDRHAQTTVERGTYTVDSNRAETPDTEFEMSYLPDLPLENEKKKSGKLRPLSPGEDRTTTHTTSTQSDYSHATTARYSLSEGEMPSYTTRRSSVGIDKPYLNPTLAHKLETPPSHQMEAALNAITDELQRCKNLLHANRYDELPPRASQAPAPAEPRPIALKPALATQGIGNTHAPMSLFTLHIGTVVLSDEAVLYSRNKNLVLKWKFYNQPVTMARMRAGRVIVFDFSTQYDIEVTDDFLNYFKHEEMPIIICELDREEQPFATATLPLRDALLLANTRADKSVALLAGPQLRDGRAVNGVTDAASLSSGGRDEVGVIDLWCMLRADASMVPGINLAIAQTQLQPDVIQQVLHDSNELDIAMSSSKPAASHEPTGKNESFADVEYNRTSNPWRQERRSRTKQYTEPTQTVSTTTKQHMYDLRAYPPIRSRTPVSAHTDTSAAPPPFVPRASSVQSTLQEVAPDMHQDSEMIMREVNTRIKTPEDVVLAAGRRRSESRSRMLKTDDVDSISQALRSSHSSLRSVLNRLQKRGSRVTLNTHADEKRNFIERLRKAGRTGDGPSNNTYIDRVNHMEIYKKYESVGKIGPNRADQSKKVTIQNEHNVDNNMEIEQPQRDVVQEPKRRESHQQSTQKVDVTVLWLALNEECEAMVNPYVQRLYVAYTFLGRSGADFETPVSLPKPKHYGEKCYFNFRKTIELDKTDIPKIGHMARCRQSSEIANDKNCIIFSVVSEPPEDPLGIESCEDIGYAFLYLGDLLAYSAGSPSYTEVIPVRGRGGAGVCGVLAVCFDGLDVVRRYQTHQP